MRIKPLIASPSPRDIPQVREALGFLSHVDKLLVKYLPEREAYTIIRSYFLEHEQYTHLIICPDDLVVSVKTHQQLQFDLEENRHIRVLSGVCNINSEPAYAGKVNAVRSHRINPIRDQRKYDWLYENDYDPQRPIIPILFAGFAYMWIEREVVERVPFRDDNEINGNRGSGGAVDVMFCNDCLDKGIDVWADMTARSDHLSSANRTLKVGVEQPTTIFWPAKV